MASQQESPLTNTIRDDFLTCKICFIIYDHPKILPCVHTYCSPCLDKLLKTSAKPGSITCPECRELVNLPNGTVSDLKTNFLINGLIDVIKVKTTNDVKCTACNLSGKFSVAQSRCLDCGDYLCEICSDGHNASSTTWKHKKVLLKDIKGGSYDKELRNLNRLTCSQHIDKQIEYFCETCHVPICLACVLLKHRDHKCVTATEAVTALKSRLISHAKKVKEKLLQLKAETVTASDNLARVQRRQDQAIENIEKQMEIMRAKIDRQKQHALQMVDTCIAEKLKQCQSQVDDRKLKTVLATDCLEFCQTMIEEGKDEEVLYLEETITKRLQQLDAIPSVEIPTCSKEVFPEIDEQACEIQDLESLLKSQVDSLVNSITSLPSTSVNDIIQHKVSFRLLRTFDTQYDSDTLIPVVKSMTINKNVIFLSDSANGKIKCISTSGILHKCLTTDDKFSPLAVAVCGNVTGAIHENYLYLFNKKGKITKKVLLSVVSNTGSHFTFALANYNNEGFIVGNLPDNYFRLYLPDGTLKKRMVIPVFYPLANLSIDETGHLVTCEWGDNCVRVRTIHGKTITNCRYGSSWKANAAHKDRDGLIYVVNTFTATVSVFDNNGTLLLQHATKPDGLRKPVNLVFDDEGMLYLVNSSGNINVYKIIVDAGTATCV